MEELGLLPVGTALTDNLAFPSVVSIPTSVTGESAAMFVREILGSGSALPALAVESSAPSAVVSYEMLRLPAPNKRTYAVATSGSYRRTIPSDKREEDPLSDKEEPEILTRMLREDDDDADSSGSELSTDTYETNFKFLVPKNSLIKQITVHLKKLF